MVKRGLDATFAALADPTRRGILEQLSRGPSRVTDLAEPYRISLPAVSRHLRVLEDAGLVVRSRVGREHRIRVDPAPIERARAWIGIYAEAWTRQLDALLVDPQERRPVESEGTVETEVETDRTSKTERPFEPETEGS